MPQHTIKIDSPLWARIKKQVIGSDPRISVSALAVSFIRSGLAKLEKGGAK